MFHTKMKHMEVQYNLMREISVKEGNRDERIKTKEKVGLKLWLLQELNIIKPLLMQEFQLLCHGLSFSSSIYWVHHNLKIM